MSEQTSEGRIELAIPRDDLILPFQAEQADVLGRLVKLGPTVDTILSLGFINPENIRTFVGYLPQIEDVVGKLCELLIASRLGVKDLPVGALEKTIRTMEDVVEGLKTMAFIDKPN